MTAPTPGDASHPCSFGAFYLLFALDERDAFPHVFDHDTSTHLDGTIFVFELCLLRRLDVPPSDHPGPRFPRWAALKRPGVLLGGIAHRWPQKKRPDRERHNAQQLHVHLQPPTDGDPQGLARSPAVVNVVSTNEMLPSCDTVPTASWYSVPARRKPSGTANVVMASGSVDVRLTPSFGCSIFTM